CGIVTSFDGSKTLEFGPGHDVILILPRSEKEAESALGRWSFDEERKLYTTVLEGKMTDYTLIKPEESGVCILARGDIGAVNIRESWFGRFDVDEQMLDYYEPPTDRV